MTEVCPSLPKTKGQKPFMVVTKNSVKSNTTTATSVLKSSPTKTKNVLRRKATNQKNNNQTSSTGSEILLNDQPKSPIKNYYIYILYIATLIALLHTYNFFPESTTSFKTQYTNIHTYLQFHHSHI